jgi:hypothetical protein
MSLVFLDTETTGLDPALHEVWEIAWAIDDGAILSRVLPHSLATADPEALALNHYWDRFPGEEVDPGLDPFLRKQFTGVTIVGSNPAFDTAFLRARWGVAPWHHRLIAVESMAFAVFGYEKPKGQAAVAADLRDRGYEIPEPDHTAAGDVATLRAVYTALREVAAK